jgi:hypothetical protein
MASEADQIPRVVNEPIINDRQSDYETESNVAVASSSYNVATIKMASAVVCHVCAA